MSSRPSGPGPVVLALACSPSPNPSPSPRLYLGKNVHGPIVTYLWSASHAASNELHFFVRRNFLGQNTVCPSAFFSIAVLSRGSRPTGYRRGRMDLPVVLTNSNS